MDEYVNDYMTSDVWKNYNIVGIKKGDVNADGKVNVSDFIATGSYILGRTITPFIFKVADLDGDNQIRVGDFIGIGNIILHSNEADGVDFVN